MMTETTITEALNSMISEHMVLLVLTFADGRVETQQLSTGRKVVQFLRRLKTVVAVEVK